MASRIQQKAIDELVELFERNGVLRWPDADRRAEEGRAYKKGYEVRFVAYSKTELRHIRRLLKHANFPLATPFQKIGRFVQPLYGKQHVERLCEYLDLEEY